MPSSKLTVGNVVLTVFIIAVPLFAALLWLHRLAAQRAQAARERFPNARLIVPGANFFGQESHGLTQLRGNGTLVLTDNELHFERWLSRREYRIPLHAIRAIEMATSYLGKSIFRPLLKVVFVDEAGNTDSMAWYVPDVEDLKRTLEEARRGKDHVSAPD